MAPLAYPPCRPVQGACLSRAHLGSAGGAAIQNIRIVKEPGCDRAAIRRRRRVVRSVPGSDRSPEVWRQDCSSGREIGFGIGSYWDRIGIRLALFFGGQSQVSAAEGAQLGVNVQGVLQAADQHRMAACVPGRM
jgi:hypothetical protein